MISFHCGGMWRDLERFLVLLFVDVMDYRSSSLSYVDCLLTKTCVATLLRVKAEAE